MKIVLVAVRTNMYHLIDKPVKFVEVTFIDGTVIGFKCKIQTMNRESYVFLTDPLVGYANEKPLFDHFATKFGFKEYDHYNIRQPILNVAVVFEGDGDVAYPKEKFEATVFWTKRDGKITECYMCLTKV